MGEWRPVDNGEQGIIGELGSSSVQSVLYVSIPSGVLAHSSSWLGRIVLGVSSASLSHDLQGNIDN